jgi:hypothetical protein
MASEDLPCLNNTFQYDQFYHGSLAHVRASRDLKSRPLEHPATSWAHMNGDDLVAPQTLPRLRHLVINHAAAQTAPRPPALPSLQVSTHPTAEECDRLPTIDGQIVMFWSKGWQLRRQDDYYSTYSTDMKIVLEQNN